MDKIDYSIHQLFPIPLYRGKVDIDTLTYHKLTNGFEWEDTDRYGGAIITHKETKERHILNLPQFSGLKKQIQKHVDIFVYDVLGTQKDLCWEITTSWVNLVETNGYSATHWHSNSLISGVFYINTDPKSGAIVFHKDRSHKTLWGETLCIDFEKQTDLNSDACGFLPVNGDLLMFPSILNHSVLKNESDIPRYSCAFNVFPKGVFGKGGNSELTL